MFDALNDKGEMIQAGQAEYTDKLVYKCPDCKEPVRPRADGKIIQRHFYHVVESHCPYGNGTGEGERHRAIKQWVLTDLAKAGIVAKDEVTNVVSGRFHRADIVAEVGKIKIVIECQVSRITAEEWERRTKDWVGAGYYVLWLWDENKLASGYSSEAVRKCIAESVEKSCYIVTADGELMAVRDFECEVGGIYGYFEVERHRLSLGSSIARLFLDKMGGLARNGMVVFSKREHAHWGTLIKKESDSRERNRRQREQQEEWRKEREEQARLDKELEGRKALLQARCGEHWNYYENIEEVWALLGEWDNVPDDRREKYISAFVALSQERWKEAALQGNM